MKNKAAFSQGIPPFFQELEKRGCLTQADIEGTADGFWAVAKSLADILTQKGITTFPNPQGQQRECGRFFDDWHLYAVPGESGFVYGLLKMREQEHDAENGFIADGDTPGVTVSFIAFRTEVLADCLSSPTEANRKALNGEIDRVVARQGQRHHPALKAYFARPQAQAPYWIGEAYVNFLAGFTRDGVLPVPKAYAAQYADPKKRRKKSWLFRFIDENNLAAGYPVCDHEKIRIRDPKRLSRFEKNALLAAHTGDISLHCFAAEIRYHACFLTWYAKCPIPFLGRSVYDSAIRADMTIADAELEGPAPFHDPNSRWVKQQRELHEIE